MDSAGGQKIQYGLYDGQFGKFILVVADEKICGLAFFEDNKLDSVVSSFRQRFTGSVFYQDQHATKASFNSLAENAKGGSAHFISILGVGTPFQIKVWKTLLSISCGRLVTYGDVARAIGNPKAVRAVGSAVGKNPISILIPCHRVINATGMLDTKYRWGADRKLALMSWESKNSSVPPPISAGNHRSRF